jgi:hypothetical protein
MQITGGKVTFGRSVQPAQYETKKAEVEITFTLAEGEALEGKLDYAAEVAQSKALEMVGLKTAKQAAAIVAAERDRPSGQQTIVAFNEAENAKDAYAAKVAQEKEAKAKEKAEAKKRADACNTAKPAEPKDGLDIPGFLDHTKSADPAAVDVSENPVNDPDADLLLTHEQPITDQDLVAAVTNTNAIVKDPKKIHAIREKFVKLPKGLRDIEQKDRPAFLAELEKLKATAKG